MFKAKMRDEILSKVNPKVTEKKMYPAKIKRNG